MSEQLQGRALDEAVARAMGWVKASTPSILSCVEGYGPTCWMDRRGRYWQPDTCFSTDPATQAEMLGWLRERCGEIGIWINRLGFYAQAAIKCPEHVMLGEAPGDFEASGDTFDEMLSRLVLEVAKG